MGEVCQNSISAGNSLESIASIPFFLEPVAVIIPVIWQIIAVDSKVTGSTLLDITHPSLACIRIGKIEDSNRQYIGRTSRIVLGIESDNYIAHILRSEVEVACFSQTDILTCAGTEDKLSILRCKISLEGLLTARKNSLINKVAFLCHVIFNTISTHKLQIVEMRALDIKRQGLCIRFG